MQAQALMEAVLQRLDRPTDSATLEQYRDRLLSYINECALDLAGAIRPWRRDELSMHQGKVELSGLPYRCGKVLSARIDGQRRVFYYGPTSSTIHFPGLAEGTVEVTYWYVPAPLRELTDELQLPEACREAVISYAVAKERARFDTASQNAARLELMLYGQQKGKLRHLLPDAENLVIYNKY